MAVQTKLYTTEDLWALPLIEGYEDKRFELDEGVLVEMPPTGDQHGVLAVWIGHLVISYVIEYDLGEVAGAETGYILAKNPDTVRAPDIGFITKSRLPPLTGKYYPIAPDLAVEIVSPYDHAADVRRKVAQYLAAGTQLVWVVYPGEHLSMYIRRVAPSKPSKVRMS